LYPSRVVRCFITSGTPSPGCFSQGAGPAFLKTGILRPTNRRLESLEIRGKILRLLRRKNPLYRISMRKNNPFYNVKMEANPSGGLTSIFPKKSVLPEEWAASPTRFQTNCCFYLLILNKSL
jgi:hypothetical protein